MIERTRAGITAAKRRGVRLGRTPKLTAHQVAHARQLIDGGESPSNVARLLGVGRSTIYRVLRT
ncbi:MAG: Hin recombinase [Deltaproteobacteria bacterium]|nr:Hin recombinase [Deltaproteobacteria bacterium]